MKRRELSLVGANAGRSRVHNRQLVLGRIRLIGKAGRAEIARSTGLTIQAVSNIIAELEADGLVAISGTRSGGRGLPSAEYALRPDGGAALGYEVRPDAILVALLGFDGECLFQDRAPLSSASPDNVLAEALRLRDAALAGAGVTADRVLGAGVVMPGPFGPTGLAKTGAELPGWQDHDPVMEFSRVLELPVTVENDANAAAMAERITGSARDQANYAFLYFGAGLGLGLIQRGQLLRGAFGNAGEIGHLPVAAGDEIRALEDVASRLSLTRHLAESGAEAADGAALAALHGQGFAAMQTWLDDAAVALAQALQVIENLFDPECVILGGAMPGVILDDLIARTPLPERSVSNRPDRILPRLMRGGSGRMTATFGAAALVLNHAFTPQIAAAE